MSPGRLGRHRRARVCRGDDGFTLLELMTVMVIIGLVAATAVFSFERYASAQNLSGTAQKLLSSLRSTAERAQSEGRTYCVSIDSPTSWSIWRYSCDPADLDYSTMNPNPIVKVSTEHTEGSATISSVAFTPWTGNTKDTNPCPSPALGCVDFSLRTTATPGSLTVTRPNSPKVYTVTVIGLTGSSYVT